MAEKSGGKAGRLAVILTGNAARAAALLGALEALEAAGLKPDLLIGVSGGAVAGALYAATGSAGAAREALYRLVATHSWQDLADIDFDAVRGLLSQPYETSGFVKGDALHQALVDSPLGHKGFQHLAVPLQVVTCDLNSGQEIVFGPEISSDEAGPYRVFARSESDLERVNVATACRASIAAPGLFRPLTLDHLCLVDGTLVQRKALTVAAGLEGVDRILWLDAGLDQNEQFSLVTDYAGQSFAAALLHSLTIAGGQQFDPHSGDPALDGKQVRYLNLGVGSLGSAEFHKTQQLVESGRRSVAALVGQEGLAAGLFSEAAELDRVLGGVEDELLGPRWAVTVGQGGRDVVAISDQTPSVQQEFGYEFDEYLTAEGMTKTEVKEPGATVEWSQELAERELGLGKLTGLFLGRSLQYGWKGLSLGFATAWQSVGLDKLTRKASLAVAEGALKVGDTLGPKPSSTALVPAAEPSEPAPVPTSPEPTAETAPTAGPDEPTAAGDEATKDS